MKISEEHGVTVIECGDKFAHITQKFPKVASCRPSYWEIVTPWQEVRIASTECEAIDLVVRMFCRHFGLDTIEREGEVLEIHHIMPQPYLVAGSGD